MGIVKWFNPKKGYGFIRPQDGGPDVFVHISAVEKAGYTGLEEGARVSYEPKASRSGKMSAENLQLASVIRARTRLRAMGFSQLTRFRRHPRDGLRAPSRRYMRYIILGRGCAWTAAAGSAHPSAEGFRDGRRPCEVVLRRRRLASLGRELRSLVRSPVHIASVLPSCRSGAIECKRSPLDRGPNASQVWCSSSAKALGNLVLIDFGGRHAHRA